MPASTNFKQWNPNQNNQETDGQYLIDTQRVNGAPINSEFPSDTANKLFYQASTGITALMNMMVAKGFSCSDNDLATLAGILANILTTADIRGNLHVLPYSPSLALDMSKYLGFQVTLAGNTTISVTGGTPGDEITLIFRQDSVGNRLVNFPANFKGLSQPDQAPNAITVMTFEIETTGNFISKDSSKSSNGLLSVAAALIGALTVTGTAIVPILDVTGSATVPILNVTGVATVPTSAESDNSLKVINSAWAKFGFAVSLGATSGYIILPDWLGGFGIQYGLTPGFDTGPRTVTLPVAFANNCVSVMLTQNQDFSTTTRVWEVGSLTRTNFSCRNDGTGQAFWLAFGY